MAASDHAVLTGDQKSEQGNDSVAATDDPTYAFAAGDGGEQDQDEDNIQVRSTRKRQRADFPWSYTHDWTKGDPPRLRSRRQRVICKKWLSALTNAQGWKVQLKTQHCVLLPAARNSDADVQSALSAPPVILQLQQTIKRPLPPHMVRRFENAIVDHVIGGDISLCAAGEECFQQFFLSSLTDGYVPPSTRAILCRAVELFSIARPLLAKFLCNLGVCVSPTMDGWSNPNLKGFYVVTAHWVDTSSVQMKSLLLTILDVSSGTGVGNPVGSALFTYLIDIVGPAFLSQLLHVVTDNGSDACAAVNHLFQLMNSFLGSKVMIPSNHVCCADHSVQRGVISILVQVKEINEKLCGALVGI